MQFERLRHEYVAHCEQLQGTHSENHGLCGIFHWVYVRHIRLVTPYDARTYHILADATGCIAGPQLFISTEKPLYPTAMHSCIALYW